jgi:large subunit ribosomal protein L22
MDITVKLNHLRISPRKVRQAVNLVRGKKALEAQTLLRFSSVKPAKAVLKLLNSAIASAKNDFQIELENLYISEIFANEGPKLKRFRPVSRGSAHPLWKRNSHIALTLSEITPTARKEKKSQETKEKIAEPAASGQAETMKDKEPQAKREKPKFARKGTGKKDNKGVLNKIFRRKSM